MSKNVPKLRFKGFEDEWKEKKLIDICDKSDKYSFTGGPFGSDLKSEHYTESGVQIIQLQNIGDGKFINDNKIYTSKEKADELISCNIYPGEIIMAKMAEPVARACLIPNIKGRYLMASDGIRVVVDNSKYNTYYVLNYINSNFFRKKAILNSTGATRLRIGLSELKNITLKIPSLQEQEKIANFLNKVDSIIEKQEKKVEYWNSYKKGMMQKIFSQKIRFKDENGRDYPEWEEDFVKNIFDITRGRVIPKTSISEEKCKKKVYPVYSSQTSNYGILGYDETFDFEGEFLTWTTDGANAGRVFKRSGKFNCTNVCGLLIEKNKGFANECVKEILERETPKHVSKVGNPKLMNGVMADIKIKLPCLEEQIKISKVLFNIESVIKREIEKLEELKQWKKGLLQQMFI